MTEKTSKPPMIWDIVTRVWHWTIVLCIPAMWLSAENHKMSVHFTLGTIMVGLIIFRLTWGLWGSTTARFAHFIKGPGALIGYIGKLFSKESKPHFGHNPLGGLSVIGILLALVVQLGTGLFAQDTDGIESGPLNIFIDYETAETLTEIHEFSFNILIALIVLHLGAIAFYFIAKKTNLVRQMFTGRMVKAPADTEKAELKKPGPLWLIISLLLSVGAIGLLFNSAMIYRMLH